MFAAHSDRSQASPVSKEARARLGRLPKNRAPLRRVLQYRGQFPHPSPDFAEEIRKLACLGLNISEIALYLQVSIDLIKELYLTAFEAGAIHAHVSVAQRILSDALHTKGMVGVEAAKFWLKNRAAHAFGAENQLHVKGVIGVVHATATPGDVLLEHSEKLTRLLEFTKAVAPSVGATVVLAPTLRRRPIVARE